MDEGKVLYSIERRETDEPVKVVVSDFSLTEQYSEVKKNEKKEERERENGRRERETPLTLVQCPHNTHIQVCYSPTFCFMLQVVFYEQCSLFHLLLSFSNDAVVQWSKN